MADAWELGHVVAQIAADIKRAHQRGEVYSFIDAALTNTDGGWVVPDDAEDAGGGMEKLVRLSDEEMDQAWATACRHWSEADALND